jgi:hypothetical protein
MLAPQSTHNLALTADLAEPKSDDIFGEVGLILISGETRLGSDLTRMRAFGRVTSNPSCECLTVPLCFLAKTDASLKVLNECFDMFISNDNHHLHTILPPANHSNP